MKTVLILRHAKSSWKHHGLDDHDRPLNKRGMRDAPRMGRLIEKSGLVPELICSSSAVRAATTARIVAESCGFDGELRIVPDLYLAGPETYVAVLSNLPDGIERAMVVGHNPGMAELVTELTGHEVGFPTAALAHVRLTAERWYELEGYPRGKLIDLWRPKEL